MPLYYFASFGTHLFQTDFVIIGFGSMMNQILRSECVSVNRIFSFAFVLVLQKKLVLILFAFWFVDKFFPKEEEPCNLRFEIAFMFHVFRLDNFSTYIFLSFEEKKWLWSSRILTV